MHLRQSRRCSLHLIDCVWPNKNEVHARLAARVKEGGRLALLGSNTEECKRLAHFCSNTGSMWASRPPWQQHRVNVGESPTLLSPSMAPTSPPEQQSMMAIPYASESSRILYSTESTSARHVASIMLSLAPTVPQVASPSVDSINTRVIASLPCSVSRMRTL